jgi:hypothetical protein
MVEVSERPVCVWDNDWVMCPNTARWIFLTKGCIGCRRRRPSLYGWYRCGLGLSHKYSWTRGPSNQCLKTKSVHAPGWIQGGNCLQISLKIPFSSTSRLAAFGQLYELRNRGITWGVLDTKLIQTVEVRGPWYDYAIVEFELPTLPDYWCCVKTNSIYKTL